MTPLDAAERLMEANASGLLPSDADGNCWYCFWHLLHDGSGHDPDCPWPVLPRIVAALEVAERVMDRFDDLVEAECAGVPRALRGLIIDLGIALSGDEVP